MNHLGIDIGLNCGWALAHNKSLTFGLWSLKLRKSEAVGLRYSKLRAHLESLDGVDHVHVEDVRRHEGHYARVAYFGFRSIIESWAADHHVGFHAWPVAHIKQFATGNGRADKDAMVRAVHIRISPALVMETPDVADAIWIALYGQAEVDAAHRLRK